MTIKFDPLTKSDFSKLHEWFNKPHVQKFYSLRDWTLDEVYKKIEPYLGHEKGIHAYIIYSDEDPIGYIQKYPIKKHPWENLDLPEHIRQGGAGFDLFIGEEQFLGKRLGCQIVLVFLKEHIWPEYQFCIVDPDVRNTVSLQLFEKCGFEKYTTIKTSDALKRDVTLQIFIKTYK